MHVNQQAFVQNLFIFVTIHHQLYSPLVLTNSKKIFRKTWNIRSVRKRSKVISRSSIYVDGINQKGSYVEVFLIRQYLKNHLLKVSQILLNLINLVFLGHPQ